MKTGLKPAAWAKIFGALALIALYACLIAPLYFNRAFVPDEDWFFSIARLRAPKIDQTGWMAFFLRQPNELGYGALYWMFYIAVVKMFPEPLLAMRGFAFGIMVLMPVLYLIYGMKQGKTVLWPVLLYLTFPMAWWTGKITGPENFSLIIAMAGLYLLRMARFAGKGVLGSWLLGLAAGIKLNIFPVFLFAVGFEIISSGFRLRRVFGQVFFFVAGFLTCTPLIFADPGYFIVNILVSGYPPNYSLAHLAHILWNQAWEWDAVFRGGFFNWGLAPVSAILFLALCRQVRLSGSAGFGFLLAVAVATLMCLTNGRFYGWYWFPVISLIPLISCHLTLPDQAARVLAGLIVITNLGFNAPLILKQYQVKQNHIEMMESRHEAQKEYRRVIRSIREDLTLVVEYTDVFLGLDHKVLLHRRYLPSPKLLRRGNAWLWLNNRRFMRLRQGQNALLIIEKNRFRLLPLCPITRLLSGEDNDKLDLRIWQGRFHTYVLVARSVKGAPERRVTYEDFRD